MGLLFNPPLTVLLISSKKVKLSEGFPEREEMELSLQKLDKDLKETRSERDKALQELARLKQHLLEKVAFQYFQLMISYIFQICVICINLYKFCGICF